MKKTNFAAKLQEITHAMKKSMRYLNIRMDGEKNIGIIQVETFAKKQKDNTTKISFKLTGKGGVESRLIEALESHFDCEVTIIDSTVTNTMNPLEIKVDVIVKSMDEDHQEVVYLEETWLY